MENQNKGMPNSSCALMLIAGAYLIYTGYKLCQNVITGVDGGSVGFFVAGVGFIVIGAGMLFIGGKNLMKNKKEEQSAQQETDSSEVPEETESEKPEEKKSMSIAERARLADSLKEEENETEDTKE